MRVAIIGMGFIGKAQARMLDDQELVTWDISWDAPYPEIAGCDFAIICAGTPESPDGSADISGVEQAFAALPDEMPVMIRSTVPPGTTARLAAEHSGFVVHAPEFMHERTGGAWSESDDVPFLIIGSSRGPVEANFFASLMAPYFRKIHLCSATEAELIKYTINLHLATRVTFINEMAGIAKAFGVEWESVRQGWLMDPRITPEYTGMDGFPPGFGGRCWPKDLAALIAAAEDAGYDPEFLTAVQEANGRFRI